MSQSTQGWYWLAAGVLALGLNGVYHDGGAEWARQTMEWAVDRTVAVVPERAQDFLQRVRLAVSRDAVSRDNEKTSCRLSRTMARMQAQITRMDGMTARQNMRLARWNANRVMEARVVNAHFSPACSRVRVEVPEVNVPEINIPRIEIPQIEIPRINIPRVSVPAVHVDSVHIPRIKISQPVVVAPQVQIDSDDDI
jgi:hypothetical protein